MTAIAFFDLDRTLLACNSAGWWLREEMRAGNVSVFDALRALFWLARYSLGSADVEHVIVSSIGAMKGRSESDMIRRNQVFYAERVRAQLRPGGLRAVREHRARGDGVVLLTSSSKYLGNLVTGDLGLDGCLCTLLEVDEQGIFTGRPLARPCFGAGKLEAARDYAAAAGAALSACAFYTDSASDLPMLEAVGKPVAVNPDRRLRRIARQRGWPVVDWGRPERSNTRNAESRSSGTPVGSG